jgi:hypothetical protein
MTTMLDRIEILYAEFKKRQAEYEVNKAKYERLLNGIADLKPDPNDGAFLSYVMNRVNSVN